MFVLHTVFSANVSSIYRSLYLDVCLFCIRFLNSRFIDLQTSISRLVFFLNSGFFYLPSLYLYLYFDVCLFYILFSFLTFHLLTVLYMEMCVSFYIVFLYSCFISLQFRRVCLLFIISLWLLYLHVSVCVFYFPSNKHWCFPFSVIYSSSDLTVILTTL